MQASPKAAKRYLVATIISGVVLICSPFVGLAGTIVGMMGAFQRLGASGVQDPGILSEKIGETLIASVAGIGMAALGLPLFITFLVLHIRERRRIERENNPAAVDWQG